jgi:2-polyprenyl-3-methyl-5-hydroxy-6-metoxy-1,4-benzoquinol methylase
MAPGGRHMIRQYQSPTLRARAYLYLRWLFCPFDRLLPLVPDRGRLLDVGCGSALWLTYLARERPWLELHGIDPDPRKLALASLSRASDRFELRLGSVADAPSASFDIVTILDVLYLVPDEMKSRMLGECFRALKAGGSIVLKDTDTRPWWKYGPTAVEELIAVYLLRITVGRPRFASVEMLAQELEKAGFHDVEARRIDRGYMHTHVVLRAKKPAGD